MKIPDPLVPHQKTPPSRKAYILGPIAAAAVGITGLRYMFRRIFHRPLPRVMGSTTVKGLLKPIEIIRDKWGVPHIYAENEEDLFFGQGFAQAQDRLFQMDVNRRVGAGRMSEILGPPALPIDRFARTFGWHRSAEAQMVGGDRYSWQMAKAFSRGVNAYIDQKRLPAEFSLLAYRPRHWHPVDCGYWGAVLGWGLSVNWESELLRMLLVGKLGPDKAADLIPDYKDSYDTVLPDDSVGAELAAELLRSYREALATLPFDLPFGEGVGSNNWVVSGDHTATGRPILANDPHLPPVFPTIWYENHLVGGRYNMTGFTSPGVPGLIIGHNEHIAWGITNSFVDNQDLYVERFHPDNERWYAVDGEWVRAQVVTEKIRVRGRGMVRQEVVHTRHGPVITPLLIGEKRALALRWTAMEPQNHLGCLMQIGRATNWTEFQEALSNWGFPSQNVVYADTEGNIGYKLPGMIPVRGRGAGLIPAPGWDSTYDWTGWVPFAELPQRFNPPEGFIATSNNRIAGDSYPYFLTGEWLPGYRVSRIIELLRAKKSLTLADMARMQMDTISLLARRATPTIVTCLEELIEPDPDLDMHTLQLQCLQLLKKWDYDVRLDSAAASIFYGILIQLSQMVFEQAVGAEMLEHLLGEGPIKQYPGNAFHRSASELTIRWLESGAPEWVGEIRPLLPLAFNQTLATLRHFFGMTPTKWHWGHIHQIQLHHHLVRIPGLGRLWKPATIPLPGDSHTINMTDVTPDFPPKPARTIVSCRMILDVGAWDNSLSALPGGQSGHPVSPHYQDGVADWLAGRYHQMAFSRQAVAAVAEGSLCLEPIAS